jgi:hypothetical protein
VSGYAAQAGGIATRPAVRLEIDYDRLGVPLGMSRIHPECPEADAFDRSGSADVLLRQEPEEEDEEEDDGDGKKDDDDDDNGGYSE